MNQRKSLPLMLASLFGLILLFFGGLYFFQYLIDENDVGSRRWLLGIAGSLAYLAVIGIVAWHIGKAFIATQRLKRNPPSPQPQPQPPQPRFGSATFERAADIVASYVEATLVNMRSLADSGPFDKVVIIDRTRLGEALRVAEDRTMYRCLFGGLIMNRAPPAYTALGMWHMLDLHSDILHAEVRLQGLRDGGGDQMSHRADLPARLDRILLRSRALELAFRHQARVAADHRLPHLIARIGGVGGAQPLSAADETEARDRLNTLTQKYETELNIALKSLMADLLEPAHYNERVRGVAYNPMPLAHILADHEGAKTINDVWMPADLAKPYLEKLAGLQAESIIDEMIARERAAPAPHAT